MRGATRTFPPSPLHWFKTVVEGHACSPRLSNKPHKPSPAPLIYKSHHCSLYWIFPRDKRASLEDLEVVMLDSERGSPLRSRPTSVGVNVLLWSSIGVQEGSFFVYLMFPFVSSVVLKRTARSYLFSRLIHFLLGLFSKCEVCFLLYIA